MAPAGLRSSQRAQAPAGRAPTPQSGKGYALALLGLALMLGAALRLAALNSRGMSADEGATWAAAAAPSWHEVIVRQALRDPGTLAANDLLLHGWIALFGQGLARMRALAALLGTLCIALLWLLVRELTALAAVGAASRAPDESVCAGPGMPAGLSLDYAASVSALLFAVNLAPVKYARELRTYTLALLLLTLQVWALLRLYRRGGFGAGLAVVVFTVLAPAVHLMSLLAVAAELFWASLLLVAAPVNSAARARSLRAMLVLALGLVLGLPALGWLFGLTLAGFQSGAFQWIKPPALWAPVSFFSKAAGSFAFPVLALLALWGAVAWWRRSNAGIALLLLWMWFPPLALLAGSYLLSPMFVERYAVSSLVPFYVLAAIGVCAMPRRRDAWLALCVSVLLALGHDWGYYAKRHGLAWQAAALTAARAVGPGETIAVAPAFAEDVVCYYAGNRAKVRGVTAGESVEGRPVLVVTARGLTDKEYAALRARYPRIVARWGRLLVAEQRGRR
ncbi:MAG: hypothetical protein M1336_04530 [Deltaproteobacteria bacterium]|nr:hypothetical protein [Deltaproteobacteria bacterium]